MSNERRPPRNMQGLLNFCTELTLKEDAPNSSQSAMDPERQRFLQSVFENLTTNSAKKIAEYLQLLVDFNREIDHNEDQLEQMEEALEDLSSLIEDIDNANDLVKMGGVGVLLRSLQSHHTSVRELCCEILGEISQNNPKAQEEMVKSNALKLLLSLVDDDPNFCVKIKALSAASSTVRGYEPAMKQFVELDGFSFLMRAIQSGSEKLIIKATFLLIHLLQEFPPTVDNMLSMGFTELLISHLCGGEEETTGPSDSASPTLCREHCCSALLMLCSLSAEACAICRNTEGLTHSLNNRLTVIKHREECQEETEFISELLQLLDKPSLVDSSEASVIR